MKLKEKIIITIITIKNIIISNFLRGVFHLSQVYINKYLFTNFFLSAIPKFEYFSISYTDILLILGSIETIGLSIYLYANYKSEILNMANNLPTQFGIYSKEITYLVIAIIIIFVFVYSFKKYNEIQAKLLDDHVNDLYIEINDEINDLRYKENINDPLINLEEKINSFCTKRKISKKIKEKIIKKFGEILDEEKSDFIKTFIYLDGKIQTYIKLKNL